MKVLKLIELLAGLGAIIYSLTLYFNSKQLGYNEVVWFIIGIAICFFTITNLKRDL